MWRQCVVFDIHILCMTRVCVYLCKKCVLCEVSYVCYVVCDMCMKCDTHTLCVTRMDLLNTHISHAKSFFICHIRVLFVACMCCRWHTCVMRDVHMLSLTHTLCLCYVCVILCDIHVLNVIYMCFCDKCVLRVTCITCSLKHSIRLIELHFCFVNVCDNRNNQHWLIEFVKLMCTSESDWPLSLTGIEMSPCSVVYGCQSGYFSNALLVSKREITAWKDQR